MISSSAASTFISFRADARSTVLVATKTSADVIACITSSALAYLSACTSFARLMAAIIFRTKNQRANTSFTLIN